MGNQKYIQNNFNGGILAQEMFGRTDQERYFTSVAEMTNFIPTIFGDAKRRYGMRYYNPAGGEDRLIPFRRSIANAYLLELGDHFMRFYTPAGRIETSPGVPYQIATPWGFADDLWLIKYAQQNDVMYLTHPSFPVQRLNHINDLDWILTPPVFDAPALDRFNTDISQGTISITPSADVGTGINFTASAPVFIAGDVGKAIIIGQGRGFIRSLSGGTATDPLTGATLHDTITVDIVDSFTVALAPAGTWFLFGSPQSYFSVGNEGVVAGNNQWFSSRKLGIHDNQKATTFQRYPEEGNGSGTAAAPPPQEDSFRTSDLGRWIISGGSCMKITKVVDSENILVDLYTPITDTFTDLNGNLRAMPEAGGLWSIEDPVFTAANGYANAIAFFQSRLWLGGNKARATSAYSSASGDYENFSPGALDNQGMAFAEDSGQFDSILWMAPFLGQLVTGNQNAEWAIGSGNGINSGGAVTPSNISTLVQSYFGSCPIQAIQVENQLLYVQRSRTKLFEFSFSIYNITLLSKDMTQFSAIINSSGFKEMVYQQTPSTSDGLGRVIWFTCNDGTLLGLTYKKDNDVWGWHKHITPTPIIQVGPTPPPPPPPPPTPAIPVVIGVPSFGFAFTGTDGPFGAPVLPLSLVLDIPPGKRQSDLLIAEISVAGIAPGSGATLPPINLPPGWQFYTTFVDTVRVNLLYKFVDGTEGLTQTFVMPGPASNFAGYVMQGSITLIRGANLATPIQDVEETGGLQAGPGRTTAGVTTVGVNSLVLIYMQTNQGAVTPADIPGTIRQIRAQGFGSGGSSSLAATLALWSKLFAAPGATGNFTSPTGWGINNEGQGIAVAINAGTTIPPPPPPPPGTNPDKIISIAVMTSIDGLTDDLWAVVNRNNGFTVEKFDASVNTDSASKNDLGEVFASVSGLDYLAGATVDVLGDGAYQGTQVVPVSGTIPLNPPARVVEVGLHYNSILTSLFIELKGGMNSQGYKKRLNKLWIRVKGTLNLLVDGRRIFFRTPSVPMNQGVPINLEVTDVETKVLGFSRTLQWEIIQDQPFPAEILAVFGDLDVGEN